jgi:acyl-CoA synthetase (NDP forming)
MNAAAIIRLIREKGQNVALEKESKEILEAAGISTTRCHIVNSAEEACRTAEKIGYPVVLKLASPSLLHKTEASGVVLNLKNPAEQKVIAAGKQVLDCRMCFYPGMPDALFQWNQRMKTQRS